MNSLVTHSNQLAGHADHLFKDADGKVLKRTNKSESNFYESLKSRNISELIMNFFPKFYGSKVYDGDNYVVLEDLTYGYEMPSIIDIKIGTSSEDPRDSEKKRLYMRYKDYATTTKSLGIRICGFKNWDIKSKSFIKEGKQFGRSITSKNMKPALRMFFYDGVKVRTDVIEYLLSKIKSLLEWWEEGGNFSLISSSLLIIYDAKVKKDVKADVRMIDFAHVHEIDKNAKDEGYISGLKSLIKIFKEIVQDEISSGEQ